MPIYEFRCNKCMRHFELLRNINASAADLKCPECGAPDPEKLFSSLSFKKNNACSSGSFS